MGTWRRERQACCCILWVIIYIHPPIIFFRACLQFSKIGHLPTALKCRIDSQTPAFIYMTNWFLIAHLYRYLVGCDNVLAKLHTKHPEICDKVGGLLAMHIDDLRALAPMWLSKTEEVREDRAHWTTNITGDIYGKGWISEMYGYSFGAAEVMFLSDFIHSFWFFCINS